MVKTIDTLVEDMYAVMHDRSRWDAAVTEFFSSGMRDLALERFENAEDRPPTLRMSNMGTPCKRKLWYDINSPDGGEGFSAPTLLRFISGDLWEVFLLSLAKAAGHDVRGEQDELEITGIRGHRDAVIDNVTVDVKSASPYSFLKFKDGTLKDNDAFGYITQLSSYVGAGNRADDSVHPTDGAFLVVNKVSGELCLDRYTFSPSELAKDGEYEDTKALINDVDTIPPRGFEPEQDGYKNKAKVFVPNGNLKLGLNCSYCSQKHPCYPGLRTFLYGGPMGTSKPVYFTHVAKQPKVKEVTHE
jgi:hypothetical protein